MSKSSKKSNSSSMEKNEDLSQLEGIAQVANGRSLFSKIKRLIDCKTVSN